MCDMDKCNNFILLLFISTNVQSLKMKAINSLNAYVVNFPAFKKQLAYYGTLHSKVGTGTAGAA
jgi:hypothetical protein